jgi:CheY-like chemotaxis protein
MRRIILCVDDEAIILLSLAEELQGYFGQSYAYETAMSASEALEIIEEAEAEGDCIAVIVSDWLMPGMRGDELLMKICERQLMIPSIMLSGHADEAALESIKERAKLSAYLRKPWDGDELQRAVRGCLEGCGV